jgi:hypothetical protein
MTKQRPRRACSTGRAMSLDQLDDWLDALDPPAKVDGASMLDGYVTAIVIGPCSIPPDEWFVDCLARAAVLRRLAAKTEDGLALPHPWCMGSSPPCNCD